MNIGSYFKRNNKGMYALDTFELNKECKSTELNTPITLGRNRKTYADMVKNTPNTIPRHKIRGAHLYSREGEMQLKQGIREMTSGMQMLQITGDKMLKMIEDKLEQKKQTSTKECEIEKKPAREIISKTKKGKYPEGYKARNLKLKGRRDNIKPK